MAAKEIKRLDANLNLHIAINKAIFEAHQAGLSTDDIRATLERLISMLEEE